MEFLKYGVRTIQSYNERAEAHGEKRLPSIVVIIDDIASFIKTAPKKTQNDIAEITLSARAAGIYLIVVTHNPTGKVLNPIIKSNLSGRFAFRVNSLTESTAIIEGGGAEKLLGVGECYFDYPGRYNLGHAQVPFVSQSDISKVVAYVAEKNIGKFKKEVEMDDVLNEVTGNLF